jgi:tetratricopeptide (TPR) repeat protein
MMKSTSLAGIGVAALIVALSPAAVAEDSSPPITDPEQLKAALESCVAGVDDFKQADQAKEHCTAVLRSPAAEKADTFTALMSRGKIDFRGEWRAQAQSDFKAAIALDPDSADAHYWRAVALASSGEQTETLSEYDKAIALKPDFVDAYIDRGTYLAGQKRYDDALSSYDKAIEISPDNAGAFLHRGRLYTTISKNDLALADFDKAIAIEPNSSEALTRRGQLYAKMGKDDLAVADFDGSLAITAKTHGLDLAAREGKAKILYGRADALYDKGAYEEAIKAYDVALELYHNTSSQIRRGEAYYALGQYKQALADFDQVIAASKATEERLKREAQSSDRGRSRAGQLLSRQSVPVDAINGRKKALCHLEGGKDCDGPDAKQAEKETETPHEGAAKDADTDSQSADAVIKQLVALCNGRDAVKAVEPCTELLETESFNLTKTDRATVLRWRGLAYSRLNKLEPAIMDYTAALKSGAPPAPVLIDRGRLLIRAKIFDEAIKDLTAALKLDAKSGRAYLMRAVANAASDQPHEAAEDFDSALRYWTVPKDASASALLRKARADLSGGKPRDAAEAYFLAAVVAKKGSSDYLEALEFGSRANLARGEPLVGLAIAEKFMELRPGYAPGYNTRGMIYLALGKNEAAMADFNKAMDIDRKEYTWAYLANRGAAYLNMGQFDRAIKDFDESLRLNPNNPETQKKRAQAEAALIQTQKK